MTSITISQKGNFSNGPGIKAGLVGSFGKASLMLHPIPPNTRAIAKTNQADKPFSASVQKRIENYQNLKIDPAPYMMNVLEINIKEQFVTVVTELNAAETTLQRYIEKQQGLHIPAESVIRWMIQLCLALEHLHSKDILHRDVTPQNICLVQLSDTGGQQDETYCVQLGDFGLANNKNIEELDSLTEEEYTYIAPENRQGQQFTSKSDIWSIGVIAYFLAIQTLPSVGRTIEPEQTAQSMDARPSHQGMISNNLERLQREYNDPNNLVLSFVTKTLNEDPERRATAKLLVEDPQLAVTVQECKRLSEIKASLAFQDEENASIGTSSTFSTASTSSALETPLSGSLRNQKPTTQTPEAINASDAFRKFHRKSPQERSAANNKYGITEEKRVGIQNQLILILHAHKCAKRDGIAKSLADASSENGSSIGSYECKVANCKRMKDVIEHLRTCDTKANCTLKSCLSTRQIIIHWQTCTDSECPVCQDVRMLSIFSKPLFESGARDSGMGSSVPSASLARSPSKCKYTPLPSQGSPQEWQLTFNLEARQSVIDKFGVDLMKNGMYRDRDYVMKFTVKAEVEAFSKANTRDRYYFLLAEKLYTAQKELLHTGGNAETQADLDKGPEQCPICFLDVVKLGCTTRKLKCKHVFHMQCVNRWLREQQTCPVCRADV